MNPLRKLTKTVIAHDGKNIVYGTVGLMRWRKEAERLRLILEKQSIDTPERDMELTDYYNHLCKTNAQVHGEY